MLAAKSAAPTTQPSKPVAVVTPAPRQARTYTGATPGTGANAVAGGN